VNPTLREKTTVVTDQDLLLVFDETVTRAGVDRWLRHLESAGAPTQIYRREAGPAGADPPRAAAGPGLAGPP
jgi:hypothetical protein